MLDFINGGGWSDARDRKFGGNDRGNQDAARDARDHNPGRNGNNNSPPSKLDKLIEKSNKSYKK